MSGVRSIVIFSTHRQTSRIYGYISILAGTFGWFDLNLNKHYSKQTNVIEMNTSYIASVFTLIKTYV